MEIENRQMRVAVEAAKRYREEDAERDKRLALCRSGQFKGVEDDSRFEIRNALAEGVGDAFMMERIMGENDLLPSNFMPRGAQVARTVCRIEIRNNFGQGLGFGSGFLIGNDLLLTNRHVLTGADEAANSLAQFDFENDPNGKPRTIANFNLDPNAFFCNDKDLDYAVVAVKPVSLEGRMLSDYGFNPLISQSGKALLSERMNVIQHPQAERKQVALRENRLQAVEGNFLHYLGDTHQGSSGSPVYNDNWFVVGLHHSSVPATDDQGNLLHKVTGKPIIGEPTGDQVRWIANEGIRISRIQEHLNTREDLGDAARVRVMSVFVSAREATDMTIREIPQTDFTPVATLVERMEPEDYADRTGYDNDFLGVSVPLPAMKKQMEKDLAPVIGNEDGVLQYTHFSLQMSKSRRLAFYTASNIDGDTSMRIVRGTDKWIEDGRLADEHQVDNVLYKGNKVDRGHLVRREDPNWGDEETAIIANEDTFHYTNCAPQHKSLNRKTWLDLERHILDAARENDIRVSVFTGPVFRNDDLIYRDIRIPAEFWKVVATVHDGKLAAAGYLQSQRNMLGDLELAFGEYKTYGVPVHRIQGLTGLDFGPMANADSMAPGGPVREEAFITGPVREVTNAAAEISRLLMP